MAQPPREGRIDVENCRREELHRAECSYRVAIAQTQKLLDQYDSLPPSEGDLALIRALKFQKEMMDEYAEAFTQLMREDEPTAGGVPAKPRKPRERAKLKPLSKTAGGI